MTRAVRAGAALVLAAVLLVAVGTAAALTLTGPPVGPTIHLPSPTPYPSGWEPTR